MRDWVNAQNKTLDGKLKVYRYSAKKRGYPFLLTKDQFDTVISSPCHYCKTPNAMGVDRKDNSLGYSVENSLPCCGVCNKMKMCTDYELFIEHIRRIADNFK